MFDNSRKGYSRFISTYAKRDVGHIGPFAYLFHLRTVVIAAIVVRLFILRREPIGLSPALEWSLVAGMAVVQLILWLYIRPFEKRKRSERGQVPTAVRIAWGCTALFDSVVISVVYALAHTAESDVFLLYVLPVLAGVEYLDLKWVVLLTLVPIPAGFFMALTTMPAGTLALFLWRWGYMVTLTVILAFIMRLQQAEKEQLEDRQGQLTSLYDFRRQIDQWYETERLFRHTLAKSRELTRVLGSGIWRCTPTLNNFAKDPVPGSSSLDTVHRNRCLSLANICLESSEWASDDSLVVIPIKHLSTFHGVFYAILEEAKDVSDTEVRFLSSLADGAGSLIARAYVLNAFREISDKTAEMQRNDQAIESILRELTGHGFEFAMISVVDPYLDKVEMVRARNVAQGWIEKSTYPRKAIDILADVIRTGETVLLEGPGPTGLEQEIDPRLNREIYERYGHAKLARIWAPIRKGDEIIGVLEAGRRRKDNAPTFPSDVVGRAKGLAEVLYESVRGSRPTVLLEMIAGHAQNIVGAQGASVHVYEGGRVVLEAGGGIATKEFVRDYGETCRPLIGESRDMWEHAPLIAGTVKDTTAHLLSLGEARSGLLCLHFSETHKPSEAELELERSFAGLVSVSLSNSYLLSGLAKTTELAWTVSSLQRVLQSLASNARLPDLLQELTDQILSMFEADNVVLHQYDEKRRRFGKEPVTSGRFLHPGVVRHPFTHSALPWRMLERESDFVGADRIHE